MISLAELEAFFLTAQTKPLTIRKGETTVDPKKFISSHLSYLKANSGNVRYLPYYERLVDYMKALKDDSFTR